MDAQQVEPLTGFRPNATHPVVSAPPIELTPENLPMRLNFKGRKYILLMTKHARLVMNGVTEE
jgi:hypothetical protein